MDNGFSSSRRETFPVGLRVLVVDDDLTWLRILEKMLKKCSYEVSTCGLAREALNLLRERKDGYDIVISDVNMPDMDGFKLLEHVGLEMDLPVIMMSVDGETSRVMKGVQHGACDYLLKPIRMKELRNIWQHVLRKRIHEGREFDSHEGFEGIQLMRNAFDQFDDWNLFALEDMTSTKKRKDPEHNKDFGDPSSTKKARVVWSVDLHQKFVKAVNQIGFDKVGPKKILDLMNVPWLTRENVASHLQKYRLYLSRLQKENNQKSSSSGMKLSDLPSKDLAGNFGFQNSIRRQQNDVAMDNYKNSDGTLMQHNVDTDSHGHHHSGIVSEPATEKRRDMTSIIPDSKVRTASQMGIDQSFAPLESEGDRATHDCTIPTQYSWNKIEEMLLQEEGKPLLQSEDSFGQPPLCATKHQIQVNESHSVDSVSTKPSTTERVSAGCIETKDLYAEFSPVSSIGSVVDTFSFESKGHMVNDESLEPIATTKSQCFNLSCMPDLDLYQRNLLLGGEVSSLPWDKDLQFCWLPGDFYNINLGLYNIGMPEYYDPGLLVEVPTLLCESTEYSVIDQGLFIA